LVVVKITQYRDDGSPAFTTYLEGPDLHEPAKWVPQGYRYSLEFLYGDKLEKYKANPLWYCEEA
jgi:hypothetical protein